MLIITFIIISALLSNNTSLDKEAIQKEALEQLATIKYEGFDENGNDIFEEGLTREEYNMLKENK